MQSNIPEIWLPVIGYDKLYEVSNAGNIRSSHRLRVINLALVTHSSGYLCVCLVNGAGRKMKRVHRVVADSFLPNPMNKKTVNHKNGIKTDNRVENLEWMTLTENIRHSYASFNRNVIKGVHHPGSRKIICINDGISYISMRSAALHYQIPESTISHICRGKRNSAYGLKFKYDGTI